jgi:hypothetical protein
MMTTSFLPSADNQITRISNHANSQAAPVREPLKHMLIGSPKAVKSTIHTLHQMGYAEVGAWSQLLPTANAGEVMSILSKQILVQ